MQKQPDGGGWACLWCPRVRFSGCSQRKPFGSWPLDEPHPVCLSRWPGPVALVSSGSAPVTTGRVCSPGWNRRLAPRGRPLRAIQGGFCRAPTTHCLSRSHCCVASDHRDRAKWAGPCHGGAGGPQTHLRPNTEKGLQENVSGVTCGGDARAWPGPRHCQVTMGSVCRKSEVDRAPSLWLPTVVQGRGWKEVTHTTKLARTLRHRSSLTFWLSHSVNGQT